MNFSCLWCSGDFKRIKNQKYCNSHCKALAKFARDGRCTSCKMLNDYCKCYT